jgi:hypothetical protein
LLHALLLMLRSFRRARLHEPHDCGRFPYWNNEDACGGECSYACASMYSCMDVFA